MKRVAAVAGVVVAMWAMVPAPARADAATPTTYRSEVTEVDPPTPDIEVGVVGGDSFLRVTAAAGTEVAIPGYQGEPFLRITDDGDVLANHNSPSFWINQDRYAQAPVPAAASAQAAPDWRQVGSGGSHGWHDHRIHWMSPDPPPAIDRSDRELVQQWTVPMVVDGQEVAVTGRLEWIPQISPVPWILMAVGAAAVVVMTGAIGWGLSAGSAAGLVVGLAQAMTSPLGPIGEAVGWLPPVVSLVLGLIAVARPSLRTRFSAVAAVVMAVWVAMRLESLWMPVLPSPLPAALERSAVAVAAGTAAAVLIQIYRRLGRQTPPPPRPQ